MASVFVLVKGLWEIQYHFLSEDGSIVFCQMNKKDAK
jgi:hypothetical protein